MKQYLVLLLLFISACSSDMNQGHEKNPQETYIHLIGLLEQSSRTGISEELTQKIFSVYDEKLLFNSGPNAMNPFMKCVKVHKDLLQIMKNASANVIQNFLYLQGDFLQELRLLKTCDLADGE